MVTEADKYHRTFNEYHISSNSEPQLVQFKISRTGTDFYFLLARS